MASLFHSRLRLLEDAYRDLLARPNEPCEPGNGIYLRYRYPVLTAAHTPLFWRYDLDERDNPGLAERFGINAVFNPGAIRFQGKYVLIARVEAANRKSFFAVAESDNGLDGFRFWDRPIRMPQTVDPDTNVYDMRVVQHQDGWIYGLFCTERRDPAAGVEDQSAAIAQCGIARTRNLVDWERLPDLKTPSPQQRNVVLHPEFVDGKYAFYTRPQDGFIQTGRGGGIGLGFCERIEQPVLDHEVIIDHRQYHTVNELKNGLGPEPIKTPRGWLHLAHGVRNTAAGLRYVLYLFMTDLHDLSRVIHKPGGYFMAPEGEERVGDVSNVLFSNGWIAGPDGRVFIYYASSDSRIHVATSTIGQLVDYVMHTPPDGLSSDATVRDLDNLIDKNRRMAARQMASRP